MKKLRWLGCLFVMSVVVIMATILVSCESGDDTATLTIDNRTSEWLKIFIDTIPQQDSAPGSIQMIGVTTNAHLVTWTGQTVQGQVTVTIPAGQNMTLTIHGGLNNYSLE
jgi:hypothetical protein